MKVKDSLSIEQQKCIEAVQKINNELHDKEGWENHTTLLSVSICSYFYSVALNVNKANAEITLFNSSNFDDRIYYEKSDKYEEWYTFLKRKYREAKDILNEIKL